MRSTVLIYFLMLIGLLMISDELEAQPVVIGQPADTSVCNGGNASFYVLAVNTVAYQWQENDGVGWYNIDETITYASGYTTPILIINDANLGLNGYLYRCKVTDGDNNSVLSEAAILGVNEPPVITINPSGVTVCKNETAVFTAAALYADSYQWQESVGSGWIDITNNAFYSGVTEPNLSIFTTTGMNGFRYRCRMVNGNCPDTTTAALLFVNPTPTLQTVTGGGSYCQGGSGLPIGLEDTEAGIAYHLYRNGNSTGIVLSGTGESISLGQFTQAGEYSVTAINGSTGCAIGMLNKVQIIVNPIPLQQTILGGGSYCSGQPAPEIFLASSQTDVQYELFKNGISTNIILNGTGFTLSFGPISETGFYTVAARNNLTACSSQMSGNVQVLQYIVPQVFAGSDQSIGQGETALLQAQVNGGSTYQYQWQPAAFVQQPQQASSSTIPLYQSRIFTVTVRDLISQCHSIADSLKVVVTGGPLDVNLTAGATNICPQTDVPIVANASGGSGNYTYSWTSVPAGFTSNSPQINVQPLVSTTYQLNLSDGNSSISKSVTIQVTPLPQNFNVTGGGYYCTGDPGLSVGLSGSQTGHQYLLYRDSQAILTKEGTGSALTFGVFTENGVYTVEARQTNQGCITPMTGNALIEMKNKPVANAGAEQLIQSGQTALLNGSATGGSGNYAYSWTPVGYLINPTASNAATVPLTTTRQFQLQVTDQNTGCISQQAQTVVFVSGTPVLQADVTSNYYNICPAEEIQLTALATGGSGSYNFSWQSKPEGFTSGVYNPTVNPIVTVTYIVTVTDGFLSAKDSVQITVRSKPTIYNLTGGGSYCPGEQAPEIKLSDSDPGVFYSLFRNGNETGEIRQGNGEPISFGQQSTSGNYQAKAFSPVNLCSSLMDGMTEVIQKSRPLADAGPDATIPYNGSNLLAAAITNGSGNYSGVWSPANRVLQPNSIQTNTTPLTSTTIFSFVATDQQSGCQSLTDTKTVFVSGNAMNLTLQTEANQICAGESNSISAITSGGTGSYTYYWTSVPEGFFGNTAQITVTPVETTTYTVVVSDGLQTVSQSTAIVVNPLPQVYSVTGGGSICQNGEQLPVGLSGSASGISYALFYEDEEAAHLIGSGTSLSFGLFSANGTYTVIAKNQLTSCNLAMNGQAVIFSGGQVIADAGPDKSVVEGSQVILEGSVISSQPGYTYSWEPAAKLINPEAIQPTTTSLTETTLFKLVANGAGNICQPSTDYVTVFVNSSPINLQVTASSTSLCPGDAVQLLALPGGGNGNYTFNWLSNPAGFTSNVFNPIFTPTTPTTFTVTVHDGTQSSSQSVFVDVKSAPSEFNISGGGSFCQESLPINLSLSGSEAGVVYKLFRNNNPGYQSINGTGVPIIFQNIDSEGIYTIKAQNEAACQATMIGEASVVLLDKPLVVASPDQVVAAGNSTTLNAVAGGGSGNYSYHWQPAALLLNPEASTTQTLPLNQSTAFVVRVTDISATCQSLPDTVIVVVSGITLSAGILAGNTQVCRGSDILLTALPEGGSGNYSYQWTDPEMNVVGTSAILTIPAMVSGTYKLTLTDGSAVATAETEITVLDVPATFELSGGGFLCSQGESKQLLLSQSESGIEYSLLHNQSQVTAILYGTGNPLTFQQIVYPGQYTVKAKNLSNSCSSKMNGEANIFETEPILIQTSGLQQIISGQTAFLTSQTSGGSGQFSFLWSPAELVQHPNLANTQTVELQENVTFTLEVIDQTTGCQQNSQAWVVVNQSNLMLETFAEQNELCPGDFTRLYALVSGGNGPISYTWSSEPSGFQSNQFNPVVNPLVSTNYTVVVSDGWTSLSATVFIEVKQAATTYQISGGGVICQGSNTASVLLSDSETGVEYTLFRNAVSTDFVLPGTGQPLLFAAITLEGQYTISAKLNATSCNAMMDGVAEVIAFNSPLVYAGADQQITLNEAALLQGIVTNGTGNYQYQWNPAYLTLQPQSASTLTVPLAQSTGFLFHAQDQQSGCNSMVDTTFVVVTGGALSLQLFPNPAEACQGSNILLTALPGGGSGNYEVVWSDKNGAFLGQGTQINYTVLSSDWVFATLQEGSSQLKDSIYVTAISYPAIFEVTGGGSFCNPETAVEVGLNNSESGYIYTLFRNYDQALISVVGQGTPILFGSFRLEGIYTVEAKNTAGGCVSQMQGSALVQYFNSPVIEAGPDQVIAYGTATQLTSTTYGGTGNYSYLWQPADLILNPGAASPITKNLLSSQVFTVQATDIQSGCTATDQSLVFVQGSTLTIDLSLSQSAVCPAQTVTCQAIPTGGSGNYTWQWTTEPDSGNGTNPGFSFQPGTTTKVKVTISDGFSQQHDSAIIFVNPAPQAYALSGGGSWCTGGSAPNLVLSGSEPNTIYELYRNGFNTGESKNGTGQALEFTLSSVSGNYTVRASNLSGCIRLMDGEVSSNQEPIPQVFQFSGGGSHCASEPGTGFLLSGSSPETDYHLFLNGNEPAGIFEGNGLPISIVSTNVSGIYMMQAISRLSGCSSWMTGTASLLVYPNPVPQISGPEEICNGDLLNLTAIGGEAYEWLTTPPVTGSSITDYPTESTTYTLLAKNSFGCVATTTSTVEVNDIPVITLDNQPEQQRIVVISSNTNENYVFFSGNQQLASGSDPFYVYGLTVLPSDTIVVVAENEKGCQASAEIVLDREAEGEININAFSPNSDNINDRFLKGNYLKVFNRWGVELYAGSEGWDGRYNGAVVSPGTYYYLLEIRDVSGNLIRTEKGSVTIVIE